jgi:hypothetical protein
LTVLGRGLFANGRDHVGVHGDTVIGNDVPQVVDPLFTEKALGMLEDEAVITELGED